MEHKLIPLAQLRAASSEDALRHTSAKDHIKMLVRSIEHYGLLVPLIVKPINSESDVYSVLDGNHRFAALRELYIDDFLVRCLVAPEAGWGEALTANMIRAALNPMDEYDVYARLVAAGEKPKDIARLFGRKQKEVEQFLALAKLDPSIKDKVRANTVSWETAQALTLVPSPTEQVALLKRCGDNAWRIRSAARESRPNLDNALFDKAEYTRRGGTLLIDLFVEPGGGDEPLCADSKLFWELQQPAINAQIEKLRAEGWKEVQEVTGHFATNYDWPLRRDVRAKKARKEHTVFYAVDADDGQLSISERVKPSMKLVQEAKAKERERQQAIEAERAATRAAQTPDEAPAPEPQEEEPDDTEAVEMTGTRPMSHHLVATLRHARTSQLKAALAGNPVLAARVLLMMLLLADLRRGYYSKPGDISWSPAHLDDKVMEPFQMWKTYQREYLTTRDKSVSQMWDTLKGATNDELVERLGHIATLTIDGQREGAAAFAKLILAEQPIPGRAVWSPDAAFWHSCGRAYMLKALEDTLGATVAARYRKERVIDLAKRMEKWFADSSNLRWLDFGGKDEPLPEPVKQAIAEWVPAILALPPAEMTAGEAFADGNESYGEPDEADPADASDDPLDDEGSDEMPDSGELDEPPAEAAE